MEHYCIDMIEAPIVDGDPAEGSFKLSFDHHFNAFFEIYEHSLSIAL